MSGCRSPACRTRRQFRNQSRMFCHPRKSLIASTGGKHASLTEHTLSLSVCLSVSLSLSIVISSMLLLLAYFQTTVPPSDAAYIYSLFNRNPMTMLVSSLSFLFLFLRFLFAIAHCYLCCTYMYFQSTISFVYTMYKH